MYKAMQLTLKYVDIRINENNTKQDDQNSSN